MVICNKRCETFNQPRLRILIASFSPKKPKTVSSRIRSTAFGLRFCRVGFILFKAFTENLCYAFFSPVTCLYIFSTEDDIFTGISFTSG